MTKQAAQETGTKTKKKAPLSDDEAKKVVGGLVGVPPGTSDPNDPTQIELDPIPRPQD